MLGTLLEETLKQRGVSQRQAAREMGVSHTTIARIIRGEEVDYATVKKVADWCGVDLGVALGAEQITDNLPERVALLIQSEPELERVFRQATEGIERGELPPELLRDLVSYAAWKISIYKEGE